jgi:hypothetical protein
VTVTPEYFNDHDIVENSVSIYSLCLEVKNDGWLFLSVESWRSDCEGRTVWKSKTASQCSKIVTAIRV